MEPSIKNQKTQAMKRYKRAQIILYNLVLYTLTSIITCFFFSSPLWFPSITNHFFLSFPDKFSFWFNAKCVFIVANIIVFILVGESKLKQSSSSTLDIYDEYVARSRSGLHKAISVEEKIRIHEEKKEVKSCMVPHGDQDKRKGMRSSKSEVWGESGMVKIEKPKGKTKDGENMKIGMRSSKSAVWSEGGMVKMKNPKGKKEEQEKMKVGMRSSKSAVWGESGMVKMENPKGRKEDGDKVKMGMRSSKSAVWSESERVKMEKDKGKKEEQVSKKSMIINEEAKKVSCTSAARVESEIVEREKVEAKREEKFTETTMLEEGKNLGMRSSRSAVWGEKEKEREKEKGVKDEKEMGMMRSSKSEIWSEKEIVRLGRSVGKEEEEQKINVLNKRVEDFIARVNKQRSLEAILVDHSNS